MKTTLVHTNHLVFKSYKTSSKIKVSRNSDTEFQEHSTTLAIGIFLAIPSKVVR